MGTRAYDLHYVMSFKNVSSSFTSFWPIQWKDNGDKRKKEKKNGIASHICFKMISFSSHSVAKENMQIFFYWLYIVNDCVDRIFHKSVWKEFYLFYDSFVQFSNTNNLDIKFKSWIEKKMKQPLRYFEMKTDRLKYSFNIPLYLFSDERTQNLGIFSTDYIQLNWMHSISRILSFTICEWNSKKVDRLILSDDSVHLSSDIHTSRLTLIFQIFKFSIHFNLQIVLSCMIWPRSIHGIRHAKWRLHTQICIFSLR